MVLTRNPLTAHKITVQSPALIKTTLFSGECYPWGHMNVNLALNYVYIKTSRHVSILFHILCSCTLCYRNRKTTPTANQKYREGIFITFSRVMVGCQKKKEVKKISHNNDHFFPMRCNKQLTNSVWAVTMNNCTDCMTIFVIHWNNTIYGNFQSSQNPVVMAQSGLHC